MWTVVAGGTGIVLYTLLCTFVLLSQRHDDAARISPLHAAIVSGLPVATAVHHTTLIFCVSNSLPVTLTRVVLRGALNLGVVAITHRFSPLPAPQKTRLAIFGIVFVIATMAGMGAAAIYSFFHDVAAPLPSWASRMPSSLSQGYAATTAIITFIAIMGYMFHKLSTVMRQQVGNNTTGIVSPYHGRVVAGVYVLYLGGMAAHDAIGLTGFRAALADSTDVATEVTRGVMYATTAIALAVAYAARDRTREIVEFQFNS